MSVFIAVLDRDDWAANTDNLAVVDATARDVVAVPRDLWCAPLGDRINVAWARGGGAELAARLRGHGFAVEGGLCFRRAAIERALDGVAVEVPVPARLEFLYPAAPTRPIEEGARIVAFEPPHERLEGERLHQWLGARRVPGRAGSDLDRIARQWTLVRALLDGGFDFRRFLADPALVGEIGTTARTELARVRSSWRFGILDCLRPRSIEGKSVLVERHPFAIRLWHASRRLRVRWRVRE